MGAYRDIPDELPDAETFRRHMAVIDVDIACGRRLLSAFHEGNHPSFSRILREVVDAGGAAPFRVAAAMAVQSRWFATHAGLGDVQMWLDRQLLAMESAPDNDPFAAAHRLLCAIVAGDAEFAILVLGAVDPFDLLHAMTVQALWLAERCPLGDTQEWLDRAVLGQLDVVESDYEQLRRMEADPDTDWT